jgi:hypothetical protein
MWGLLRKVLTMSESNESQPAVRADENWGLLLEAVVVTAGDPVLVRTTGEGVTAGRIAAAAGSSVVLREVVPMWSWSGGSGTGSLHDLAQDASIQVRRSAILPWAIILDVHSVQPLTEERYVQLRETPAS